MHLPAPNFAFTIPSIYDGTQLDCRIHLPRHIQQPEHASTWQRRGAIVAHPYAPLGGCYDDPVVSFISAELLRSGCIVGTFNFRGAAGSEGRTSWTAKPELADYVSFYGFMLHYLRFGGDTTSTIEARGDNQEGPDTAHIILGGYSFGSLVASHLPQLDVIRDLFDSASSNDPGTLGAIRQIAHNLSSRTVGEFGHQKQQDSESSLQQTPKATISYLLVSPLLPPISLFLTLFAKFSLEVGMETSVQGKNIPCPKPTNQLCAHRALVIYGNEDAFTSASKLRNWADEISRESRGRFEAHEIDGASHFWREDGVEAQAQGILREWIRRLPDSYRCLDFVPAPVGHRWPPLRRPQLHGACHPCWYHHSDILVLPYYWCMK